MKAYSSVNKSIPTFKLLVLSEIFLPLLISALISYLLKSRFLFFWLYLPISNVILPLIHLLFSKSKSIKPILEKNTVPNETNVFLYLPKMHAGTFFGNLHKVTRQSINELFEIFKSKNITSLKIYLAISKIRSLLIIVNIFRLFPMSMIFNNACANTMFLCALLSIFVPNSTNYRKQKKPIQYIIKKTLVSFLTLPQCATVIFDGFLRSVFKFLLKNTFFEKWLSKSQYAYLHSNLFLYIASYFWAFLISMFLIFSSNVLIGLCGVLFMLSPFYLIYFESKPTQ